MFQFNLRKRIWFMYLDQELLLKGKVFDQDIYIVVINYTSLNST